MSLHVIAIVCHDINYNWFHNTFINVKHFALALQDRIQKLLLEGSFVQNVDLINKIVVGKLIVDLLFESGVLPHLLNSLATSLD